MTKAGEGILNGINDAIAYMQGDESKCRSHMIMTSKVDVKSIREKIGLTQIKFAETYGLSLSTLKKWETGNREPEGAAKAYLTVIAQEPDVIKNALHSAV